MVFITRSFKKLLKLRSVVTLLLLLCAFAPSQAAGIRAVNAIAYFPGERIEIHAIFDIQLSDDVEQALHNGVALPFIAEFELTRPRWRSWLSTFTDMVNATETRRVVLSYQALTRKYHLENKGLARDFDTLDEALSAMGFINHWQILSRSSLANDSTAFAGRIRLRLENARLPKTYQLGAIGQDDWDIASAWAPLIVTTALSGGDE